MTDTRDATTTPERGRASKKQPLPARVSLFYRQVLAEMRKVIWPTRKELVTYTTVVIFFVLMVIAYVTALDYVFGKVILAIFG